jgi:hypothetical protein
MSLFYGNNRLIRFAGSVIAFLGIFSSSNRCDALDSPLSEYPCINVRSHSNGAYCTHYSFLGCNEGCVPMIGSGQVEYSLDPLDFKSHCAPCNSGGGDSWDSGSNICYKSEANGTVEYDYGSCLDVSGVYSKCPVVDCVERLYIELNISGCFYDNPNDPICGSFNPTGLVCAGNFVSNSTFRDLVSTCGFTKCFTCSSEYTVCL